MQRILFSSRAVSRRSIISQSGSCRGYRRMKAGTGMTSDARDAALLKKLESQLAELKKKVKDEETDAYDYLSKHADEASAKAAAENEYVWFWEKVLSDGDRKKLASYKIHSLEDLQAAYFEADVAMTKPPFPKLESLEPRLQLAHDLQLQIPEKIAQARRASSLKRLNLKNFFGGLI